MLVKTSVGQFLQSGTEIPTGYQPGYKHLPPGYLKKSKNQYWYVTTSLYKSERVQEPAKESPVFS
jgi:hypothetical protein